MAYRVERNSKPLMAWEFPLLLNLLLKAFLEAWKARPSPKPATSLRAGSVDPKCSLGCGDRDKKSGAGLL